MGCICSKKSDANGIKRKKKRVQAVSSIASSSANNDALTRREEGNGSRENSLLVSRTADIGSNSRLGHSGFSEFSETDICRSVFVPDFGYELRYSFISQRGYYPDDLNKGNQDSFCIHTSFGNDVNDNYFGVFDGHGDTGAECSRFVSRKLCENLLSDPDFKHDAVKAYLNAFTRTNSQLHEDSIDDSMSGTTAITVLIRGNTLYVANVGDSRAVIAERRGGKLAAVDLSKDQTPYRDDECERVKKCGARVMTMEQIEGNKDRNVKCWDKEDDDDGDPPRVWVPNAMFPGTAFTRSLGDRIAETVGVCAVPEVLVKQFTPDHPFLIIASDGVFEFLSSQKIVDIVAAYDDPQAACQAVVIESYQTWLQNENRTDDITVIVVQIRGLHDSGDTRNRNDFSTLGGVKHVMTSYDSSQEVFDFTESSQQDKATLMCPTYSHQKQQEESASNSRNEIDEPLHKIITS